MGRDYRTIKLTYNGSTYQIDVRTLDEAITYQDFSSIRRTLDGSAYEQYVTANIKRTFSYTFPKCDTDVFDFFNDAFEAKISGFDSVLDWEEDDGTFTSYDVLVRQPTRDAETVGTTGKIYKNVSVEVIQI